MNRLNLDDIQLFIQVVDHGSFTAAAEYCNIPKSTLSRRIRDLEQRMAVRLLNRSTRRLTLTELGETFYQRALGIVHELESTERLLSNVQEGASGRIRILAPVFFNALFTAEITEFCQHYPDLTLDLRSLEAQPRELQERLFDLLLHPGEMEDSSLVARQLASCQLNYFASPDYLQRRGRPEQAADIADHDCILLNIQERSSRAWRFGDSWQTLTRPRFTVDSPELAVSLASAGLGIAQLPVMVAASEVAQGRLQPLFAGRYAVACPIYAAYRERRFLPQKIRLLISYMEQTLQPTIDRLEHLAQADTPALSQKMKQ